MRCPHCKAPVPAGNNTCLDCGKKIFVQTGEAGQNNSAASREHSGVKSQSVGRGVESKKSKGKNPILPVVLILILMFCMESCTSDLADVTEAVDAVVEVLEEIAGGGMTGTSLIEYNEDGSYQETFTIEGEGGFVFFYDADGVPYKDEMYDGDGNLIYVTWYQDNQEVRCDFYQDNTLTGTWYMEYDRKADSDEAYLCCEYYICVGDTEWSIIYFYGEDDGDIYVLGEAERDPDTGELIYCTGTDNNGNELADLYG